MYPLPRRGPELMLVAQPIGPTMGISRLVLAHGFSQNSRCWGPFGQLCSNGFDVTAIDAPGHGQSGHDQADLYEAGRLTMEVGGRGHYLGYSMGGRTLLHAALTDTLGVMQSLILIGANAGIDDDAARRARQSEDNQLATHIESIGTEAFINEWLARPMFASLTPEQACRSQRLENSYEGLAASLRRCGTGSQMPVWDKLAALRLPVLVIAGSRDAKFTAIGKRMVEAIGANARFVAVEGGHAVHLENPEVTAAVVASWGSQLG